MILSGCRFTVVYITKILVNEKLQYKLHNMNCLYSEHSSNIVKQ